MTGFGHAVLFSTAKREVTAPPQTLMQWHKIRIKKFDKALGQRL